MSEIHWEPTAHLRFVERDKLTGEQFDFPPKIKVLQQKWLGYTLGVALLAEWRDVPLEVEDE